MGQGMRYRVHRNRLHVGRNASPKASRLASAARLIILTVGRAASYDLSPPLQNGSSTQCGTSPRTAHTRIHIRAHVRTYVCMFVYVRVTKEILKIEQILPPAPSSGANGTLDRAISTRWMTKPEMIYRSIIGASCIERKSCAVLR